MVVYTTRLGYNPCLIVLVGQSTTRTLDKLYLSTVLHMSLRRIAWSKLTAALPRGGAGRRSRRVKQGCGDGKWEEVKAEIEA